MFKTSKIGRRDIPHKLIGGSSFLAVLAQSSDPSLLGRGQKSCTDGLQDPEKPVPQLSSEEESALLQQLMSLTPEQLSSLPPEQQQQVLVIQQTLRSKTLS
ncbi:hypothetical protein HPP92_028244 [Vanilla planifolia]|uniref:Transcription termination and cleavage factor C-terminal domain-containing protein n=1 Tax=Vanilla planifolia TaxID=51239 RepID=A0A835PBS9_VANPL|nr:hypothetical protein HPP92_028244 [Vanilla planifolia]